nr:aminopeptidase P family N-terminal domain-containing protein [Clostridiales bacterium]
MNKMENRYAKLRAKMEEMGLDAIYVSSPENHLYVTDFDNPDGYAFVTRESAWVFADSRYIEAAKAEATDLCTVCLPGQPGLLEIVKDHG